MRSEKRKVAILAGAALMVAGLSGCATKKDIRTAVTPLDDRVGGLEVKTASNSQAITEADEKRQQDVARLEELAKQAQQSADDAGEKAGAASYEAKTAQRRADEAHAVGEKALRAADSVSARLANLGNFRLHDEGTVLFDLNKSVLTDEAQTKLDELMSKVGDQDYVVEIEGYTDTSGTPVYNQTLSEKRASAVMQYLVTKHEVPLRRVFNVGLGSLKPAVANDTRDGRQQNRRVEIRIFLRDIESPAKAVASSS
jgi:OmpA-OmpF porin, OOP family